MVEIVFCHFKIRSLFYRFFGNEFLKTIMPARVCFAILLYHEKELIKCTDVYLRVSNFVPKQSESILKNKSWWTVCSALCLLKYSIATIPAHNYSV